MNRHTPTGRGFRSGGFTLLEALIAIAIAAMALGALSRAVGQAVRAVSDVSTRQQAAMVAQSVLARGTFAEEYLAEPEGQSPPWSWRVTVDAQPVPLRDAAGQDAGPPLTAARLTIEVFRRDNPRAALTLTGWKPFRSPT